jgi:hypothetical protein
MMAHLKDEVTEHFSRLVTDTMSKHKTNAINDEQLIERLGRLRGMESVVISTLQAAEKV